MIKRIAKSIANVINNEQCRREYQQQDFRWVNERAIEYGFLFNVLTRIVVRDILDVGTGTTALPHLLRTCGYVVTAMDNIRDYWPKGMANRHFHVINDDITKPKMEKAFDLVTCISVIEHIVDSGVAVTNMFRLLRPGGYLVLTCPYSESHYARNVYALPEASYGKENPYVCQVYSRAQIDDWQGQNNLHILEQEYWRIFSGELWTFGEQIYPREQVSQGDPHHLTCLLFQKGKE